MILTARKIAGGFLLASFLAFTVGLAMVERAQYRAKIGIDEAEPALTTIGLRAEAMYVAKGKLCPSSALTSDHPFSTFAWDYAPKAARASFVAGKAEQTGFACLGISPTALGNGKDMFSYESYGTGFVARAFTSYLYDPGGTLPRWEIRGEVVDGRLVIAPIERLAPGGPTFLGHPSQALY